MDSSTITIWTGPFLISAVSDWFLLLSYFKELSELNANNVDPDQTPRSAASDLGLRCLPMSLLWEARLEWLNMGTTPRDVTLTCILRETPIM